MSKSYKATPSSMPVPYQLPRTDILLFNCTTIPLVLGLCPEFQNLGILESWNLGILESWNLGILESRNVSLGLLPKNSETRKRGLGTQNPRNYVILGLGHASLHNPTPQVQTPTHSGSCRRLRSRLMDQGFILGFA